MFVAVLLHHKIDLALGDLIHRFWHYHLLSENKNNKHGSKHVIRCADIYMTFVENCNFESKSIAEIRSGQ
jgi:uncharacterized protein (DUF1919 family)